MTTTIRSFDGETLLHIDPESAGGHWVRAQREGESGWIGDSYRRAELLAALDAVSKADERVGAKTRAALRARAEDAEAFGAAAVARAEEAEATIERVREELEAASTWAIAPAVREALRSALDPKPAFTLPTEAGAVVEYTDHHGSTQRWFRTRDTQRPWVDREGNTWHDAGVERDVAGDFTVLIGADK